MQDIKKKMKILLIGILTAGMAAGCSGEGKEAMLDELQEGEMFEEAESSEDEAAAQKAEKDSDISAEDRNPDEEIYVFVCGQVMTPGVYKLPADSRIYQAIEAAGGLLETAAGDCINQAELMKDGQRIYIPTAEEVQSGAFKAADGNDDNPAASASDGRVNLNTASKEELMTLTGIGERKAEAILQYRDANGSFRSVEDLMQVDGIKEGTFEKIKDDIAV